jgi:hypothetical protein
MERASPTNVTGKTYVEVDIFVGSLCDQLGHLHRLQYAVTAAGDTAIPAQSDEWNAHPQGIKRRRCAVVRKRVERNIDVSDRSKVLKNSLPTADQNPLGIDESLREALAKCISCVPLRDVQHYKRGLGNAREDAAP